jgi:Skp family chaperone for outer membrane proteins
LRSFDYQINNHPRGDFQIEGVSEEICDRFSKQDAEVDRAFVKLLAEKPEFASANIKELRSKLATQHRTRKQKDLSRAELRTLWDAQLSDVECISLRQLPNRSENIANTKPRVEIGKAVQWAEDCNQANLTARGWREIWLKKNYLPRDVQILTQNIYVFDCQQNCQQRSNKGVVSE